jgi:hypothetical protein
MPRPAATPTAGSPADRAARKRALAAERMRRLGLRCLRVEIGDETVEGLRRAGLLEDTDVENEAALAFAIGMLIDELVTGPRKNVT